MPRTITVRWMRKVVGQESTYLDLEIPDEAQTDPSAEADSTVRDFVENHLNTLLEGLEETSFEWEKDSEEAEDYSFDIVSPNPPSQAAPPYTEQRVRVQIMPDGEMRLFLQEQLK